MPNLLEIRGARRNFITPEGGSLAALDGVDLDVAAQEFVTLLGPSGCGKTTLLRAIAGFESLDSGTLQLEGRSINELPPFRRPVNTVFQSYALFGHMSVARNVGYALEVAGMPRAEREVQVRETLAKVGLSGMGSRRPAQLSGGQRQRVALARAIIAKPKLLLLDEPLSALDRNLRQQMQLELKSLQHALGIAFIFVTHDQEEALTMSDRIVVMRAGRIEQIGTPRDIYRQPKNRFVAEFIGETNVFPVTVTGIKDDIAIGRTETGLEIALPAAGRQNGENLTAILRPTDFSLAETGIPGTIARSVYLGADQYLLVQPRAGGPQIRVIAREDYGFAEGASVHLAHDLARVHVLEQA